MVTKANKDKPLTTKTPIDLAKEKVEVLPTSKSVKPKSTSKKPFKAESKVPPAKVDVIKVTSIDKPKKSKLIRDSFTIPENEYKLIQVLKERSFTHGISFKKSELLRAGILKLISLKDPEL